ncbi:hypothetical protein E5676_scaffold194G001830 [Cucumis melo var. makuwa]|uniref:Uncharacterized protein n=1 Tax=Cucumis melo var. makuwa TaxID=1194695 RepID=A0A5A7VK55_CUCMM|nr:hypothetical protein E6C27_scaffold352G001010 [Cucumis melo var. makuwa]TYJ97372.1 hypothetical protein E5676_scaffold194G001830 [Cucumis melo var. makuwa]
MPSSPPLALEFPSYLLPSLYLYVDLASKVEVVEEVLYHTPSRTTCSLRPKDNVKPTGYTQYNNVYKFYDVVGPTQHSHRLCRSGAHPALTTASLSRSSLNVNNRI